MTHGPVLALDAALDGCLAGVVASGGLVSQHRAPGGRGSAAALPALAARALSDAGLEAAALAAIAVTIGPGSFTGVRAALALAQGIGLAAGIPVIGVTVADAIRAATTATRPVWIAIDSRRGRIFLDTDEGVGSVPLDALPAPRGPVAVAGDAAIALLCRLAAKGHDMQLLPQRACSATGIAIAASNAPRPPLPLYVDAVAARPNPPRPHPRDPMSPTR